MSDKHHNDRNFWLGMGLLWWLAAAEDEEERERIKKEEEERQEQEDSERKRRQTRSWDQGENEKDRSLGEEPWNL